MNRKVVICSAVFVLPSINEPPESHPLDRILSSSAVYLFRRSSVLLLIRRRQNCPAECASGIRLHPERIFRILPSSRRENF